MIDKNFSCFYKKLSENQWMCVILTIHVCMQLLGWVKYGYIMFEYGKVSLLSFSSFVFFFFCQILYETSSDEEEEEDGKSGGGVVSEGHSPSSEGLVDVEDIGSMMGKMKSAKKRREEEEEAVRSGVAEPREMVTPMLRKSLSKQGVYVCMYGTCES